MATYRTQLPQLGDRVFLTDSGLETTLIFHDGYDLPAFAAFPLLDDDQGQPGWLTTTGPMSPSPSRRVPGSCSRA